jgi:hypothetical protein
MLRGGGGGGGGVSNVTLKTSSGQVFKVEALEIGRENVS